MVVDFEAEIDIFGPVQFPGEEDHSLTDGLFPPVFLEGFFYDLVEFGFPFEDRRHRKFAVKLRRGLAARKGRRKRGNTGNGA